MDWKGLQSERVFFWFSKLCEIPHGSGNTKAMSDFCVTFAKERKLEWKQDEWNNVIILKPASAGSENKPALLLQAHLDMVCAKEQESEFDFIRDGLELCREGDFLFARGTTLGADDGIGVAMILALLESDYLEHPPLEAVFTTDEETGMDGAKNIDLSSLTGTRMINIDSEKEGVFTVGCAGGTLVNWTLPVTRCLAQGQQATIQISGLTGGHSGMEIGREGASAITLLGKLLFALQKAVSFSVFSVSGGMQSNAIPIYAQAELVLTKNQGERAKQVVHQMEQEWKQSFKETDSDLRVTITLGEEWESKCLTNACSDRLVDLLYQYPQGVISRDVSFGDMVKTSLNLGIVRTDEVDIKGVFCVRSSVESEKMDLVIQLKTLTEQMGGNTQTEGDYPGWEVRTRSPLQDLMKAVYRQQTAKEPVIETIHAGLECGLFADQINDLDCVSIGPDLFDIHTIRERLSISSVERLWIFLMEVLKRGI